MGRFKFIGKMRVFAAFAACWAVIALGLSAPAFAQNSEQNYAGPRMTYSYDGPRVTDEDVYRAPDDRQLNLNYARQQAAKGDLLGASSALERLLYMEPNWHSARLFYAAVLYRLDDKQAAQRELSLLNGRGVVLNEQQKLLFSDYSLAFSDIPPVTAQNALDKAAGRGVLAAAKAETAPKPVEMRPIVGRVSIGVRGDNNAGNALSDVDVGGGNIGDVSVFAQGALRAQKALTANGSVAGHIGITGQTRRHESESRADFDTLGARAGATIFMDNVQVLAEVQIDRVNISGEKYLVQAGPRVTFTAKPRDDTKIGLTIANYHQDFDNISTAPFEAARTGNKSLLLATIEKKVNSRLLLTAGAGAEFKNAQDSRQSYSGLRLQAGAQTKLDNGWTLKAQAAYRALSYEKEGLPAGTDTKENRFNARLSAGLPVSRILGGDSSENFLSRAVLEGAVNINTRNARTGGQDFDNVGAEMRLTWDF